MNKKLVAVAIAGLLAAPLAQAQTANVTLYGRVNLNMVFVNGTKARRHEPERLPGRLELVALRHSWHRVARWRPQCDFPDRERFDQHGRHGRHPGRPRHFRRLERLVGHVLHGPLQRAVRRYHRDRGEQYAQYRHSRDRATCGRKVRRAMSNGGFDNRLKNSIRWDSPNWAGFVTSSAIRDEPKDSPSSQQQPTGPSPASTTTVPSPPSSPTSTTTTSAARSSEPGRLGLLHRCPVAVQPVQHCRQVRMAGLRLHAVDLPQAPVLGNLFDDPRRRQWQCLYCPTAMRPMARAAHRMARGSARLVKGDGHRRQHLGSVLRARPVEAHVRLHRLCEGQQRQQRGVYFGNFRYPVQNGANPGGFSMGMWHNF